MSIGGRREALEKREDLFVQAYPFARRSTQVHSAALSGHAMALLDPEDLGQEVLLHLWRALQGYDHSRSSLRTYTETIVASTITSALRRGKAKKRTRGPDFNSSIESVELSFRIERRIDLSRALCQLEGLDLRVARFLLRDCKPTEVARKLGVSRAAVYRSLDRIRLALEARGFRKYL